MAFQVTLQTMIVFFLILAVGFAAGKLNVIRKEYMGNFAALITKVFLPVMIFSFTVSTVTRDILVSNLWLILAAIVTYVLLLLVAFLVAKLLRLPHDRDRIFQFAFIFGNTGFVGFPLLSAVFPETGMLFMCLFNVVDQLVFWTYGIWLSTGRGRAAGKFNVKSLLSPNIIAIVLSLLYVISGLPLPGILETTLGTISKGASPLCMMYLGATICFSPIGEVLKRPDAYVYIVVKMVLLPIAVGFAANALALPADMVGCIVLFISLPVMTVVPMIAGQNSDEGPYATGIAVLSFIACLVTIPLVAFVVF